MKRVFYTSKTPDTFEEHLDFNYEIPYTVRIKKFQVDDIVPLHYGDTIEILICDHLTGFITIEGQRFEYSGQQLFIIPPNCVHSTTTVKCSGTMYVIKVSLEDMKSFVCLSTILDYQNKRISHIPFTIPEYERVFNVLTSLIDNDTNFTLCISNIIYLFSIFQEYTSDSPTSNMNMYAFKNSTLRELITWTQNNFKQHISITEVAKRIGYSKCYFCNKFKKITGITYLDYLNSVRLSHACFLLKQNQSISSISYACGFDNVSYFIQLFKKIHKMTPKAYAQEHQKYHNSHQ